MRTTGTKKIMGVGHSLTVNVTKEVKAMGLDRGDYVNVTLEPCPSPFIVQDRETGTKIESCPSLAYARCLIAEYETRDKEDGVYSPNFYEVAKWDGNEYVPYE